MIRSPLQGNLLLALILLVPILLALILLPLAPILLAHQILVHHILAQKGFKFILMEPLEVYLKQSSIFV